MTWRVPLTILELGFACSFCSFPSSSSHSSSSLWRAYAESQILCNYAMVLRLLSLHILPELPITRTKPIDCFSLARPHFPLSLSFFLSRLPPALRNNCRFHFVFMTHLDRVRGSERERVRGNPLRSLTLVSAINPALFLLKNESNGSARDLILRHNESFQAFSFTYFFSLHHHHHRSLAS